MPGDSTLRYVQRHREQAKFARDTNVPGHQVSASMDYRKMFASRPGSADWQACCTCGWGPKLYYYGESEAMAACGRHLKSEMKKEMHRKSDQGPVVIEGMYDILEHKITDLGKPLEGPGTFKNVVRTILVVCKECGSLDIADALSAVRTAEHHAGMGHHVAIEQWSGLLYGPEGE